MQMQMNIIRLTEMLLPAITPPAFWDPLMGCSQKQFSPLAPSLARLLHGLLLDQLLGL